MILDIAQIALPEIGQKIQRKFSGAKVSIWLCAGLCRYCGGLIGREDHLCGRCRNVSGRSRFAECKRK